MKRKEAGWKFLWVAKRKLLWGVVFGLMMALPGISGAQMKVDVNLRASTVDGVARVNTIYTSQFTNSQAKEVQQNQYLNNVLGFGGPTTVGVEFQTNGNSEIAFAGLSILKKDPGNGETTMLTALEKIGTGSEDLRASFVAAGGSQIRVTETVHVTQASTLGGNLVYQVQSSGVGSMEAGVVGKLCTECLKCEEPSNKGKIEDLRLQAGLQIQQAQGNLMTGIQHVEAHVDFSGKYSGIFQAIVGPTN
jgi:hypothetical protein